MFDPVSLVWAVAGLGVVAYLAMRAWGRRQTPRESSLGSISDRWLAEQRLNRKDSER